MPYTLAKWALWLIAAAAVGLAVGWMLRGLRRPGGSPVSDDEPDEQEGFAAPLDSPELIQLRGQVKQVEQVVAQNERLRVELAECRAAVAANTTAAANADAVARAAPLLAELGDRDRLGALVAAHEATIGDLRARLWNQDAAIADLHGVLAKHHLSTAPSDPDLLAGAEVLGEKIRLNDLTVVEGIGPKIANLLHTSRITTWWELSQSDTETLQSFLTAAGPRFQVQDPATWPQQAGLLANGQWAEFKELTDQLKGGKLDG